MSSYIVPRRNDSVVVISAIGEKSYYFVVVRCKIVRLRCASFCHRSTSPSNTNRTTTEVERITTKRKDSQRRRNNTGEYCRGASAISAMHNGTVAELQRTEKNHNDVGELRHECLFVVVRCRSPSKIVTVGPMFKMCYESLQI